MNADEIVRALRCGSHSKDICMGCGAHIHSEYCHTDICGMAADLIDSLQAQISASQRREKAAVEDLKYYLENNEGNGVVYVPKFVVERIIRRYSQQEAEEGENNA